MAEPKTLTLFNGFKQVVEEHEMFQPDKSEEKSLKKLDDACDTSPWFEPKPEPSNLLQDSTNLRRRSSGNNRPSRNLETKSLEIQTPCPWSSMLNQCKNGRLMAEDVYELGCSNEQLALVVPSSSPLFSTLPKDFFRVASKKANCKHSLRWKEESFYQVPCSISCNGFVDLTRKDTEARFADRGSANPLRIELQITGTIKKAIITADDVTKSKILLFGRRSSAVLTKHWWEILKRYRSFQQSASALLQLSSEVHNDPIISHQLVIVFYRTADVFDIPVRWTDEHYGVSENRACAKRRWHKLFQERP
jgi:hypothetical protein